MCFESWAPGSSSPWPLVSLWLSCSVFLLETAQVCGWNSVSRGESRSSRQRCSCCLSHIVSLFYFFFFLLHDFTTPSRCFPDVFVCLFVCWLVLVLGAVKFWKHKEKNKGGIIGTYEKFTCLPLWPHLSPEMGHWETVGFPCFGFS